MRIFRFTLAAKGLVALLAVGLPLAVAFFVTYQWNRASLARVALEHVATLADAQQVRLDQYLEGLRARTDDAARCPMLQQALTSHATAPCDVPVALIQRLQEARARLDPSVRAVLIMARGVVLASTEPSLQGRAVAWTPPPSASVVIDTTSDEGLGGPGIVVAAPVPGPAGQAPSTYVVSTVALPSFEAVVKRGLHDTTSRGPAYLETIDLHVSDATGLVLADTLPGHGLALLETIEIPSDACATRGSWEPEFSRDRWRRDVVVAVACLPTTGWRVAASVDSAEVLAPLAEVRRAAALTAALVGVVLAVLYALFRRAVVTRLRGLRDAADRLAAGEIDLAIPKAGNDEIGEALAAFARMAAEIARRREQEGLEREALRRSEAQLAEAQRVAHVGSWEADLTTGKGTWSDETWRIYGREPQPEAPLYEEIFTMFHEDDREPIRRGVEAAAAGGPNFDMVHRVVHPDGSIRVVRARIAFSFDDQHRPVRLLGTVQDVTEKWEDQIARRAAEARRDFLQIHDEATGLLNRSGFIDAVDATVSQRSARGDAAAVMILDLDEFKLFNDAHGHRVGDEYLRRVAGRIEEVVRALPGCGPDVQGCAGALVGRLGGDEFALLLPVLCADDAMVAAEAVREALATFTPLGLPGRASASLGLALSPAHGRSAADLLTRADVALYRAKEGGRNRVHLFRDEDRDLESMHSRLREKERVEIALAEDRFVPWFQPILGLADGDVRHYEALARMIERDGTVIAPGGFIETAERFGLIGAIDRVVARKTMQRQAELARAGRQVSFSMNLSGKDLDDERLLASLSDLILDTGADPGSLIFEITETAAVRDLERAVRWIKALKDLGCRFSLDDFGVGFSSFAYLKHLPVDYVKIDGSFIRRLDVDAYDRVFVKAIASVAGSMGIRTVAEFVENAAILENLLQLGVDYAQGYLIGRPAPEPTVPTAIAGYDRADLSRRSSEL